MNLPPVPQVATMPAKRPFASVKGEALVTTELTLRTITPIVGGGTITRSLDDVDVIRPPTIRGHLRMWWRALYAGAGELTSVEALATAERTLWGGASDDEKDTRSGGGGRSPVEIQVDIDPSHISAIDSSEVNLYKSHRYGPKTPGAYALWTARSTRPKRGEEGKATAPRREPGTIFKLTLRYPETKKREVENALRAWILFGGYGGRTRRGLGSVTLETQDGQTQWLPATVTKDSLEALFDCNLLAAFTPPEALRDTPLLRGARLAIGSIRPNAQPAWLEALDWLQNFRQAQPGFGTQGSHDPQYARDRGDRQRPGRSNWPESDKVRRLSGSGPWAHPPNHDAKPVWPRAGFGLPIIGQFQMNDRNRGKYRDPEPRDYKIHWRKTGEESDRERLASPLIVKALPLADGRFVAVALWLNRGYPDGKVTLSDDDHRADRSAADFDQLEATPGEARFQPLIEGQKQPSGKRLQHAFFYWLNHPHKATEVR